MQLKPAATRTSLTVVLIAVAVIGPVLAYAGVKLIYSESDHAVTVGGRPPILFAPGDDYEVANKAKLVTNFTVRDSGASFVVTVQAVAGGNVTIDKYAKATKTLGTASYKIQIGHAYAGTLTSDEIDLLRVRLWSGQTAPTSDTSPGVCAVVDLFAPLDAETSTACTAAEVHLQVVLHMRLHADGSSTVSIRPSSITFL